MRMLIKINYNHNQKPVYMVHFYSKERYMFSFPSESMEQNDALINSFGVLFDFSVDKL